jgi:3'(2'), 5'-bisphosphate nucleotidase
MLSAEQTDKVLSLLILAGKEIMNIYRSDYFGIKMKPDDSPVTLADLAADELIKKGLSEITPGIPVYSEETKDVPWSERAKWNELWILDPLDGTKEFIGRTDEFCISLALVEGVTAVAGFIYAPVSEESWFALKGSGAWKIEKEERKRLPLTLQTGPYRLNVSRTHHSSKEELWINEFKKENEIRREIIGSAIKFCRIAEGLTDLYPKFSLIHEWDIAAGQVIIEEAGGRIIEPATGKPPVFNKEDYHQPPFVAFGARVRDWEKWV